MTFKNEFLVIFYSSIFRDDKTICLLPGQLFFRQAEHFTTQNQDWRIVAHLRPLFCFQDGRLAGHWQS